MIDLNAAYLKLWLGAAGEATRNELRLKAIIEYAQMARVTTSDAAVVEALDNVLELAELDTSAPKGET